jgi:hypothetical protein
MLAGLSTLGPAARAGSIADWTNPWDVKLGDPVLGGTTSTAIRAFGAPSTMDGQITDRGVAGSLLPDTDAVIKARADVGPASFAIIQSASVRVDFDRPFELSQSPSGFWKVTITLSVNGTLSTTGTSSSAGIQALFKITDSAGNTLPGDGVQYNDGVTLAGSRASTGAPTKTFVLPDGNYQAVGFVLVNAQSSSDPGGATSNFFSTVDGMVSATTVPEPPSIALASISTLAVAGWRWRHRRACKLNGCMSQANTSQGQGA